MQVKLHAFFVFFFSPPHRFCVSLSPRRKDEDTQKSNFNRKIVNRKIVNITMILFFRTPSKSVIAVECNHELPQADSDKLCWLFGEATPESEDNLKGHFVGPRREMITPWSTNAVEITQNMGLDGIIRIEEYFPVKDENADHDPMLQRMYKGLDQNVFTTNRQPEPIVHIEDLEAYNEKEGLALSKEEMDYLKKVEKDLGRPLTDSEVFGFAQINSEHCRHKIFGGTFIIDGVEQESSLFQMIKKTTQENPNKIISAYKDNVAFAEVMHTALSYFQAGRAEAGYKLLKSSVLDGMYLGDSPGNFGQISFYDAARGECYRDFGDPIGVASRVLIQGLFGILPDALNQQIILRPGFPDDWDKASVSTPDISYRFTRKEDTDTYHITQRFQTPLHPVLHVNARKEKIRSVKVNGVPATWQSIESAHGYPLLSIQAEGTSSTTITIEWEGAPLHTLAVQEPLITSNGKLALQIPSGASISQVYDPQSVLAKHTVEATAFNAQLKGEPGHHTFFVYTHQGEMDWWQPVNIYIENVREAPSYTDFADIRPEKCRMVDFDRQLNASVTDIYQNEYLSPRSPYTTLQLPTQGIGEWCHPLLSATIDDSGLRSLVHHDTFQTSLGIPFRLKEKGNNILFTSLWDNYPDSSTISLSGTASHAYLLMVGSTNHMQCHIANGIIRIHYADGTSQATELINPDNWCPIEQDFYVDGKAFQATAPRPYRLHLKSGKVSRDLGKELNITGVYGREIEGGAGILLDIPLDHSKELKGLTLETLSNDVVIGIMGITLQ